MSSLHVSGFDVIFKAAHVQILSILDNVIHSAKDSLPTNVPHVNNQLCVATLLGLSVCMRTGSYGDIKNKKPEEDTGASKLKRENIKKLYTENGKYMVHIIYQQKYSVGGGIAAAVARGIVIDNQIVDCKLGVNEIVYRYLVKFFNPAKCNIDNAKDDLFPSLVNGCYLQAFLKLLFNDERFTGMTYKKLSYNIKLQMLVNDVVATWKEQTPNKKLSANDIDKEKKNRANQIKALCSFMVGFANHKKMAIGMETFLEERILQRLEMLFEIDLDTIPRGNTLNGCLDKASIYLNGLTSDQLNSFVYPVAKWNGIIF